jgi:hypothetical protein
MSHPIIMSWKNTSSDTFNFKDAQAREGTLPSASPTTMGANGASTVSADQTGNLRPGPVGSFVWQNATDANQSVSTSYIHPAGTGQSSVTVSCSGHYEVSSDGATWYQAHTFTDPSLQHHDATITLSIRKTS